MTRIQDSFDRQALMRSFGAKLVEAGPGHCVISAPMAPEWSQQHGAAHAGFTFALGDSAAGYAALSLLPETSEVMTSEMKIHLLRPATGQRMEARGRVLKAGKRLIVAQADVFAFGAKGEIHVATLLGTMVPVDP